MGERSSVQYVEMARSARAKANRAMCISCSDMLTFRRTGEDLTPLPHGAFAGVGAMGLNCTCVDQTDGVTRQRTKAGQCFVAVWRGRIIAAVTVYARVEDATCEHYPSGRVATIRQLGVDRAWRARGIGCALLDYAERWAASHGYSELALDTSRATEHFARFYKGRGFHIIRVMRFAGNLYESAIFSKAPVSARTVSPWCRGPRPAVANGIRVAL